MSLSANFPEEPWLRLRAENGKCAGRRRQPRPSGEAVCKVLLGEARSRECWVWTWGERSRSGRPRVWHLPRAWSPGRGGAGIPQASCFLLGLPCSASSCHAQPTCLGNSQPRNEKLANLTLWGLCTADSGRYSGQEEGLILLLEISTGAGLETNRLHQ